MLTRELTRLVSRCAGCKRGQDILTAHGMIEWSFRLLQSHTEFNHEMLIQLTGTLMNLLARSKGRATAQNPKLNAMKTLVALLIVESTEVLSYVNGCIYSLIGVKAMRNEAKVHLKH